MIHDVPGTCKCLCLRNNMGLSEHTGSVPPNPVVDHHFLIGMKEWQLLVSSFSDKLMKVLRDHSIDVEMGQHKCQKLCYVLPCLSHIEHIMIHVIHCDMNFQLHHLHQLF